ncbi:type I-MYXAN CRISPR-associated protein Cas6/Cmx6 [Nostoc spongiaeforme FACHB-130]|uniref:Type I-MYXAN CRISPR-associated protein Cas6/Cmx6 n=1 Tax=Nostoc spongiaeforme FACHB-130 TaxID=1357510 RepID=A0ABR8G5A8_9NOSO|nr:type I-MYXAN CRISPR-associated protein Cas6/Cmx6 [Nostoc spongiaeforme]MBD2598364.1 type I-MYXAN CRISPR-associated protein Cas6/Cmx6 [Nostoc spongiaeforme FACHB-130]
MNNIINLSFPVTGTELWADHNHRLCAAICTQLPELHELKGFAINTITGIPNKQGKISLTHKSRLLLRLPVEAIAQVYQLTGKTLDIGGYAIQLGNPELQTLKPVESLKARIVTIKGYTEPALFLGAAHRQLQQLEINANIGIPANEQGEPKRLTLTIKKKVRGEIKKYTIVGFSVIVSELSAEDSIKLQIHGLGGKRRLGCGIFCPNITIYQGRREYDAKAVIS